MRIALLFCSMSCALFAGTQSLTPLILGTYTLPNSAPFNAAASFSITIRIHNWTIPGTAQDIQCTGAGGLCLNMDSSGNLRAIVSKDTLSGSPQLPLSPITTPDLIARLRRDTVGMTYALEVFNPATGSCSSNQQNITGLGNNNWSGSGGGFEGGGAFTGYVAYARWSTATPPPICTGMPLETDAPGNLLDYEFEGGHLDTSGNGIVMSMTGDMYTTTPVYAPTCQGQDPGGGLGGLFNVNVISTNTLSPVNWVVCVSESAGTVLNYTWTKGTCPNSTLTNGTMATPSILITASGQCALNLSVADSVPNTTTAATTLGAVQTDSNCVVVTGNSVLDQIIRPEIRYGCNPWPYYDQRMAAWLQHIGALQNAPQLTAPSASAIVNGTTGSTTISYVVVATDVTLGTVSSVPVTVTTANATLSSMNSVALSWGSVSGATSYTVYRTAAGGTPSTTGQLTGAINLAPSVLSFTDTAAAGNGFVAPIPNTTGSYQDQWNTALSGTITLANAAGSTTVTGVGTNFQHDFCNGGTSQAPSTFFVPWIPDARATTPTVTKRVPLPVSGSFTCTSATQIVLTPQYNGPLGTSGMSYSVWTTANSWVGASTNNNYYDNVLAFYAMYYRTGITQFLTYARTLADRWFTMPDFDQGLADCNVDICVAPRIVAYTGMIVRELDCITGMVAGLDAWADTLSIHGFGLTWGNDIREQAYGTSVFASCGIVDTTGHKATCQGYTQTAINSLWTPQRLSDGSWTDSLIGGGSLYVNQSFAPSANLTGTVTATIGSSVLVGSGTGWSSASFPPNCTGNVCDVWLTPNNSDPSFPSPSLAKTNQGGDCTTYHVTLTDATHMQLDRPYDGCLTMTSASGLGYQFGTQLGWGTQPFMMGVVGGAMDYAYKALLGFDNTTALVARGYALDAAHWIINHGVIGSYMGTTYNGLAYAVNFANCTTPTQILTNPNCSQIDGTGSPANVQGIRYLNMEVMHAFTAAQELAPDSVFLNAVNVLYGASFGGLGGPFADSNYLSLYLDNGAFDWNTLKAKTPGFMAGWGAGSGWPAAQFAPFPASVSGARGVFGSRQLVH